MAKEKKNQIKPTVRNIHIPFVKIFLCTAKLHELYVEKPPTSNQRG